MGPWVSAGQTVGTRAAETAGLFPQSHPHPTAATLTFWSPVLLLAVLTPRLTSSPGASGHLEEPVGFLLAGGLGVTSTTTPGEVRMPKVVQPSGAELGDRGGEHREAR